MQNQPPELRRGLLERRTTRRALLGGAAAVAAVGSVVAVAGIARPWSGSSATSSLNATGQTAASAPTPNLDQQIADPRRRAAHLLRRAGFGGTLAQIDEFSQLSREDAADRLLNYQQIDNSALDTRLTNLGIDLNQPSPADLMRWWLTRMVYTARPLEERMTFIWHGLLTSQVSKIGPQRAKLMIRQNELFRSMALPKHDDLIKAVSKDPAMLIYLDTIESLKAHPNENYARELMELFTLGVGNYTEQDVRESARAFTGWRVTPPKTIAKNEQDIAAWDPQFFVDPRQHDTGTKTFLGKTGNWGGDDVVDIIMQQPAAGRFIARRLFTRFASTDPGEKTLNALVDVWNSSNRDIRAIVRAILTSDEFYSERSYRAFVRSPVEFIVNAMRGLELEPELSRSINDRTVQGMDQVLFEPPNVAGWPGGDAWLSSSTFFARANFLDELLFGRTKSPPPLPALGTVSTADDIVDRALAIFLDGNVSDTARQAIADHAKTIPIPAERAATVAYLVLGSPEYQLI
jgi:uncharacterized protein (DUF1800 family)